MLKVIFVYHLSSMTSSLIVFGFANNFMAGSFWTCIYFAPYTPIFVLIYLFLPHLSSFSTLVLKYSLEEKLSVLKDENHVLRQKALSATPRSTRPNFVRALSEVRHFVNNT